MPPRKKTATLANTIVIVDGSYFIFYRFFATLRWFKFRNKDRPDSEIVSDAEFIPTLQKHIESSLKNIIKKHNISVDRLIFCKDCPQSEIWRMKHLPTYKAGRVMKHEIPAQVFVDLYESQKVFGVDHLEADDCAALIHRIIRTVSKTQRIVMITNDNDYMQLVDEATTIEPLSGAEKKATGMDLVIKILTGDKSDNIPPIYPMCGQKTAARIAEHLEEWLQKQNTDVVAAYERNRLLIDFAAIPENLVEEFNDKWRSDVLKLVEDVVAA